MKRILITGCQRSGTTLMGLIMDSHPFISNVDEANFNSIDDLSSSLNSCAKLPQESANLNFIKNVFKPDSVIWMIRNPYDVIKSMVSLQISRGRSRTESWGSTYSHVEISKMLQYLPSDYLTPYQDLLGQYRATLSNMLVRSSDQGNIISCITCWVLKQECYRYLLDSGLDVVVVRYEDLVSSPSSVLPKLFKRLGFDWHDDVLRHHELHAGMSIGNTNNSRAIDLDSLFYSNNFFSDTELTLISKLTSSALLDFRYPVITSNTDFKSGMKSSMNDNFTPGWLVYGLSCAVNQERSRDFFVLISQLTTDDSKHSASVIDQVCETLFDEWSIKKLSSDSFLGLTGKLSKYIGAISLEKQRKLVSLLESHSPQWKILSAFQKKSAPQIDYIGLYEKNGAAHADVAHALVFLIGHFGSSENIHAQWSCLMQLIKQFPDLKYAKDVATALVNTLPSDINGSSVLLSWLSDELSKQELHKIFYKFIHKSSVDINGLNTKDFTINSYSDAYIAWRLGNTLLLEEHSLTQTTTSDFAGILKSSQFQPVDFEGGASIYVGPDKPRKLVVCFTGFGSMLMHPLSLIHAVIDIDDDVGVLWLQDIHSKVFLTG